MTIKIYRNKIEFIDGANTYSLGESAFGIELNSRFTANNIGTVFQGTVAGYTSGGSIAPGAVNTIDKFPFANDSTATDAGDLSQARNPTNGHSSTTHGYTSAGPFGNLIDKFPFATSFSVATSVGVLFEDREESAGHSSYNHGYVSGGRNASRVNTIDKFSFSADANATNVGDLTQARSSVGGSSSSTHGYTFGGVSPPTTPASNVIDRFAFSIDSNASDVGDLVAGTTGQAYEGNSSYTHGYNTYGNVISKFPFAASGNSLTVGSHPSGIVNNGAGQSSITSGYKSGGFDGAYLNTIAKFSFATDTDSLNVGTLSQSRTRASSQQD